MSDLPERRKKLSPIDRNALHVLQKHGELLQGECGVYFKSAVGAGVVKTSQAEKLVQFGYCRIDRVGQSVFAVYTGKST